MAQPKMTRKPGKPKVDKSEMQRKIRPKQYRRRAFMLDSATEAELAAIQVAVRTSTASATVRYVVRKMAHLMRQCAQEHATIQMVLPISDKRSRRSFIEVDIPPLH